MDTKHTASKEKLSRAPSWIMLGFVLGAVFMHSFYPRWFGGGAVPGGMPVAATTGDPVPTPAPTPRPVERAPNPNGPPLMEVEGIFSLYRFDAIWEQDTTEIAIWNRATERFSEFFQVLRTDNGSYYFRTITSLSKPVMEYAGEEGRPIRFTEPEAQRMRRMENLPLMFQKKPPQL